MWKWEPVPFVTSPRPDFSFCTVHQCLKLRWSPTRLQLCSWSCGCSRMVNSTSSVLRFQSSCIHAHTLQEAEIFMTPTETVNKKPCRTAQKCTSQQKWEESQPSKLEKCAHCRTSCHIQHQNEFSTFIMHHLLKSKWSRWCCLHPRLKIQCLDMCNHRFLKSMYTRASSTLHKLE